MTPVAIRYLDFERLIPFLLIFGDHHHDRCDNFSTRPREA